MLKELFKSVTNISKITLNGFSDHSVMTYAASIAFYTIFSLPGLLITIVISAGFFLGQEAAQGELVTQLHGFIGSSSAKTIENIITKVQLSGDFTVKTIIGVATLLFSATTIFISLQEALNRIWDVVATPERGIIKFIINRVLSFGMIISLGFILIISLLLDSVLTLFFHKLENLVGRTTSLLLEVTSTGMTLIAVFIIILLIFKILPDVILRWKDVIISTFITTILLSIGNYLIGWYISTSNFSGTYEAAGSIIIILVWVYYSTVVLLIGAEITRAISIHNNHPIRPAKGAKKVSLQQMDYDSYQEYINSTIKKTD
jgi:membrane protein